jgi:LSD1 subclass zinc finger protein
MTFHRSPGPFLFLQAGARLTSSSRERPRGGDVAKVSDTHLVPSSISSSPFEHDGPDKVFLPSFRFTVSQPGGGEWSAEGVPCLFPRPTLLRPPPPALYEQTVTSPSALPLPSLSPPPSKKTGDQIICTGFSGQGCRTLLVYPQGASNVRCALCNTITPVPPAGTDMAQLDCGGCRTRLMYVRGGAVPS